MGLGHLPNAETHRDQSEQTLSFCISPLSAKLPAIQLHSNDPGESSHLVNAPGHVPSTSLHSLILIHAVPSALYLKPGSQRHRNRSGPPMRFSQSSLGLLHLVSSAHSSMSSHDSTILVLLVFLT